MTLTDGTFRIIEQVNQGKGGIPSSGSLLTAIDKGRLTQEEADKIRKAVGR